MLFRPKIKAHLILDFPSIASSHVAFIFLLSTQCPSFKNMLPYVSVAVSTIHRPVLSLFGIPSFAALSWAEGCMTAWQTCKQFQPDVRKHARAARMDGNDSFLATTTCKNNADKRHRASTLSVGNGIELYISRRTGNH